MSKIYIVKQLFRGRCADGVTRTFLVDDEPTADELGEKLFEVVVREGWLLEKSDVGELSDDDRTVRILDYMANLLESDPEKLSPSWTGKGKPDAKVMSDVLGFKVSASLRDEIWALQTQ